MISQISTDEIILGFDARVLVREIEDTWADARKEAYLLKKEVLQPYSTDSTVWPSVIDYYGLQKPSYTGFYDELWENLDSLEDFIENNKSIIELSAIVVIAVTLMNYVCTDKEKGEWLDFLKGISPLINQNYQTTNAISAIPDRLNDAWSLLGYDVSDRYGLSALSNCGFNTNTEDVQEMRNKWKPYLNQYHLFVSIESAVSFKAISNERVKEHAPFFVFGLYSTRKWKS